MIREALHACRFHPDLRHLAEVWPYYQIKVGIDFVVARWMGIGEYYEVVEPRPVINDVMDRIEILGKQDLLDVINILIKAPLEILEFYLPQTTMLDEEMEQLFKWGESRGWKLIDHAGVGMTVTRKPVDEEIEWRMR